MKSTNSNGTKKPDPGTTSVRVPNKSDKAGAQDRAKAFAAWLRESSLTSKR